MEEPACRSPGPCPKPPILPPLWESPAPPPGVRVREAGASCPASWARTVTAEQPGPLPPGPVVVGSRRRRKPCRVCRPFRLHSDKPPPQKPPALGLHGRLLRGTRAAHSPLMIQRCQLRGILWVPAGCMQLKPPRRGGTRLGLFIFWGASLPPQMSPD